MYKVSVTLNNSTVETFEYETRDAFSAIQAFQQDLTTRAVHARDHALKIDASPL